MKGSDNYKKIGHPSEIKSWPKMYQIIFEDREAG